MKKLMLLGAAAVGYVLGTRAGRERYEQIKSSIWRESRITHHDEDRFAGSGSWSPRIRTLGRY